MDELTQTNTKQAALAIKQLINPSLGSGIAFGSSSTLSTSSTPSTINGEVKSLSVKKRKAPIPASNNGPNNASNTDKSSNNNNNISHTNSNNSTIKTATAATLSTREDGESPTTCTTELVTTPLGNSSNGEKRTKIE